MQAMTTAPAPPAALNDDACWQAVAQRRTASDGLFVVAVRTTKIYCRPSCPSRTPKRENVRFYPSPSAAETAGFRACKRCRPREGARPDAVLVREICAAIEADPGRAPTLADLSARFGKSSFHLQRVFKRITGVTPKQYAEARRTHRARTALRGGNGVSAAIYEAGYGSSSRLYERAGERLGMTPARYRRRGEGMAISYTIASCDFGRMLVAATERGVAAVKFAASDADLEDELRSEYSAADIRRDDASMHPHVASIVESIAAGTGSALRLPLDIRATAFRIRVYEALRQIPLGATRSYSDIARAVGSPKSVRAVGTACAQNPVAIAVPCHRVVREDGSLGGYRYGLDRKRAILDRERSAATREAPAERKPVVASR